MEPLFKSLVVGLVPQPRQVPPAPFEKEELQRVFFDVNRVRPYSQFAFLPADSGAQMNNGLEDRILITPGLLQVVIPVSLTSERAREASADVLRAIVERLKLEQYIQCGIKVVAHAAAPGERPDARAFVAEQLMIGGDRAAELGPDFFGGGVKFRRIIEGRHVGEGGEANLLIEPFVADNQYIWIDYDIQRIGGFDDLDDVSEWVDDAFGFVKGPVMALLEA